MRELLERAESGVREVIESERYKEYFSKMAKFHHYSARNVALILNQNPSASYVAGYVAWKNNFGRQVQRGEPGIQIIGYSTKNIQVDQVKKDAQGIVMRGPDGKEITERVSEKVPVFYPTYVWDISQTEGEPLPQLSQPLTDAVNGYTDLFQAITDVSEYPISVEEIRRGAADGYCDHNNQKIVLRAGMSEARTVETAIHELAHSILHAPSGENELDRRTKEVQAESTAYVVCEHYGIDTSDYSFAYIASWSRDAELKELMHSMDVIQNTARGLINKIDARLEALQRDREIDLEAEHAINAHEAAFGADGDRTLSDGGPAAASLPPEEAELTPDIDPAAPPLPQQRPPESPSATKRIPMRERFEAAKEAAAKKNAERAMSCAEVDLDQSTPRGQPDAEKVIL